MERYSQIFCKISAFFVINFIAFVLVYRPAVEFLNDQQKVVGTQFISQFVPEMTEQDMILKSVELIKSEPDLFNVRIHRDDGSTILDLGKSEAVSGLWTTERIGDHSLQIAVKNPNPQPKGLHFDLVQANSHAAFMLGILLFLFSPLSLLPLKNRSTVLQTARFRMLPLPIEKERITAEYKRLRAVK